MRRVPPLVLGVLVVVLAAGCGRSNPAMIPPSNAQAMQNTADRIAAACSDHDTSTAYSELHNAEDEVAALPSTTSTRLVTNLKQWLDQIHSQVSSDCKPEATPTPEATETTTPTSTPSPSATATPTQSASPTPTASAAPTDTATAAPTDTATAPPVQTTTPVPTP